MEIGQVRKARMGEIPHFYALDVIYANQGVIAIRGAAIAENLRRPIMPVMEIDDTEFDYQLDRNRRMGMVNAVKRLRHNGENHELAGAKAGRIIRKVFLWIVFFGFMFCVAYTFAGLIFNGTPQIW